MIFKGPFSLPTQTILWCYKSMIFREWNVCFNFLSQKNTLCKKNKKPYNKRLGLNLIYAPLFYHGSLNKYRYLHINVVALFPIKPINIFEFYHNVIVTEDLVLNLSFISQQFLYLQAYRKTIFSSVRGCWTWQLSDDKAAATPCAQIQPGWGCTVISWP